MENVPLESTIVRSICRRLDREPGCWHQKNHGTSHGRRGIPDITGSLYGRAFALEVKRPKVGRVTRLQEHELQKLANAGAIAAVVESLADACEVLGLAR